MLKKKGFTIIELIVVIGVVAVVGIITLSALLSRRTQVTLNAEAQKLAAVLREAQSRSMAQAGNASWGVHMENGTTSAFFALFSGTYSSSTIITYESLPASVLFSTTTVPVGSSLEVTFTQITGTPSTSTSIGLQLTGGGSSASSASVSRSTSGKIFFDDFNRSSL